MGCGESKPAKPGRASSNKAPEPRPCEAWLEQLGMPQYAPSFIKCGYDSWEVLASLNERDIEVIEAQGLAKILPGHRKRLLIASTELSQTMSVGGGRSSLPPQGSKAGPAAADTTSRAGAPSMAAATHSKQAAQSAASKRLPTDEDKDAISLDVIDLELSPPPSPQPSATSSGRISTAVAARQASATESVGETPAGGGSGSKPGTPRAAAAPRSAAPAAAAAAGAAQHQQAQEAALPRQGSGAQGPKAAAADVPSHNIFKSTSSTATTKPPSASTSDAAALPVQPPQRDMPSAAPPSAKPSADEAAPSRAPADSPSASSASPPAAAGSPSSPPSELQRSMPKPPAFLAAAAAVRPPQERAAEPPNAALGSPRTDAALSQASPRKHAAQSQQPQAQLAALQSALAVNAAPLIPARVVAMPAIARPPVIEGVAGSMPAHAPPPPPVVPRLPLRSRVSSPEPEAAPKAPPQQQEQQEQAAAAAAGGKGVKRDSPRLPNSLSARRASICTAASAAASASAMARLQEQHQALQAQWQELQAHHSQHPLRTPRCRRASAVEVLGRPDVVAHALEAFELQAPGPAALRAPAAAARQQEQQPAALSSPWRVQALSSPRQQAQQAAQPSPRQQQANKAGAPAAVRRRAAYSDDGAMRALAVAVAEAALANPRQPQVAAPSMVERPAAAPAAALAGPGHDERSSLECDGKPLSAAAERAARLAARNQAALITQQARNQRASVARQKANASNNPNAFGPASEAPLPPAPRPHAFRPAKPAAPPARASFERDPAPPSMSSTRKLHQMDEPLPGPQAGAAAEARASKPAAVPPTVGDASVGSSLKEARRLHAESEPLLPAAAHHDRRAVQALMKDEHVALQVWMQAGRAPAAVLHPGAGCSSDEQPAASAAAATGNAQHPRDAYAEVESSISRKLAALMKFNAAGQQEGAAACRPPPADPAAPLEEVSRLVKKRKFVVPPRTSAAGSAPSSNSSSDGGGAGVELPRAMPAAARHRDNRTALQPLLDSPSPPSLVMPQASDEPQLPADELQRLHAEIENRIRQLGAAY